MSYKLQFKPNRHCFIYPFIIVLGSGCTVALQLMTNDRWLGCAGPRCVGAPCPGVFFEGSDWQRCWGEVFKIYRKDGAGQMKVGDYVGLFYPRENVWFSMWGNFGHKLPCPGPPNTQFGFASRTNWGKCAGEALQIFAKGKRLGQTITDQDTIAFHYPHGRTYVQILPDRVGVSSCLIDKSGGRLPPSNDAFDQCKFSSVEITIYD